MDRFREPDNEPEQVETCAECGGEIYVGDAVTLFPDSAVVHEDCEYRYLNQLVTRGNIDGLGAIG